MTIEQIELRKILTQMLADNGVNRETIVDFVKDIVNEKVDKAITQAIHESGVDKLIESRVRDMVNQVLRAEASAKVRQALGSVTITFESKEKQD